MGIAFTGLSASSRKAIEDAVRVRLEAGLGIGEDDALGLEQAVHVDSRTQAAAPYSVATETGECEASPELEAARRSARSILRNAPADEELDELLRVHESIVAKNVAEASAELRKLTSPSDSAREKSTLEPKAVITNPDLSQEDLELGKSLDAPWEEASLAPSEELAGVDIEFAGMPPQDETVDEPGTNPGTPRYLSRNAR